MLLQGAPLVDVRSESEFQQGHFQGSINIPILNDLQRHEVGITYKTSGQTAAITLGYKLVDPAKKYLISAWSAALGKNGMVMCWRGGMRSQICREWLAENQVESRQVQGGYKQLRKLACQTWGHLPPLTVLGGFTGSCKTELLLKTSNYLDLEGLANHRGSAFGYAYGQSQPAQATFENNLALSLKGNTSNSMMLVEDESPNLGRCFIPKPVIAAMVKSRVIWLEVPLQERVANIFEAYVSAPLQSGITQPQLAAHFLRALMKIKPALGGALTQNLQSLIEDAFTCQEQTVSVAKHHLWIAQLLSAYYDKRYLHSCGRHDRPVCFRGDLKVVKQYLQEQGLLNLP